MTQAKKSYSDWLIASDIDGTLNTKFRSLPKRNFKAIERFINEYDGNFTLASGRNAQSLEKHYMKLQNLKIPAIITNGAGIYDFKKREMIFYSPINREGEQLVIDTAAKFPSVDVVISGLEILYIVGKGFYGNFIPMADNLDHEHYRSFDNVPRGDWGKAVFTGTPRTISRLARYLTDLGSSEVTLMSTSVASFEVLNKNTDKGTAVLRLAQLLGVDKSHTGAIGDYFNDYEMLRSVAVPACCGQAPKALKQISRYVACHCNRGAVADYLEYLERTY